jgi:serine O-acetyltransferase
MNPALESLSVAQLSERLLASYLRGGGINHVDCKNLPSKHAIADITVDLLRLLFPGFFDERLIHSSEIEGVTIALLHSVLGRLESEIRKSLEYAPPPGVEEADLARRAHSHASFSPACLESGNYSRPMWRRPTRATQPRPARTK